jgi:hypothetical protein
LQGRARTITYGEEVGGESRLERRMQRQCGLGFAWPQTSVDAKEKVGAALSTC